MNVYHDFFMYREGIYQPTHTHHNARPEGYHSIRILGWGEEADRSGRPVKYWVSFFHFNVVLVIISIQKSIEEGVI